MITRNEIIDCLSTDFEVLICSIIDLHTQKKDNAEFQVIVLDELNNNDSNQLTIDLNYERNLLSDLKKPIVFILSTSTVSRLIRYSASFWSCVSLHKFFGNRFGNLFEPHFISSDHDLYLNGVLQTISSSRLQVSNSKKIRINQIIKSVFNTEKANNDIKLFLKDRFSKLDRENKKDVESFAYKILTLIDRLQLSGFFSEAEECINVFYYLFDSSKNPLDVTIRLLKNTAEIKYKTEKYDEALEIYELLHEQLVKIDIHDEEYSILMNNIGVIYYKQKRYNEALDCYHAGVECVNYLNNSYPLIHLLYNLSLLHWVINDVDNSFYYIESAIKIAKEESTYYSFVLIHVFSVFYSYLQINCGEKDKAIQKLVDALDFFRKALTERCISVMETHYVFAVLYYYSNQLGNAFNCAKKAYSIAKQLNVDLWIRVQLRELLGEISFFSKNYSDAYHFFSTCINYAEKNNLFSTEVLNWIKEATVECGNYLFDAN